MIIRHSVFICGVFIHLSTFSGKVTGCTPAPLVITDTWLSSTFEGYSIGDVLEYLRENGWQGSFGEFLSSLGSGECDQTTKEVDPYFQLSLDRNYFITSVSLTTSSECSYCGAIESVLIEVGDADDWDNTKQTCTFVSYTLPWSSTVNLDCNIPVYGNSVRFTKITSGDTEALSLCGFVIQGYIECITSSPTVSTSTTTVIHATSQTSFFFSPLNLPTATSVASSPNIITSTSSEIFSYFSTIIKEMPTYSTLTDFSIIQPSSQQQTSSSSSSSLSMQLSSLSSLTVLPLSITMSSTVYPSTVHSKTEQLSSSSSYLSSDGMTVIPSYFDSSSVLMSSLSSFSSPLTMSSSTYPSPVYSTTERLSSTTERLSSTPSSLYSELAAMLSTSFNFESSTVKNPSFLSVSYLSTFSPLSMLSSISPSVPITIEQLTSTPEQTTTLSPTRTFKSTTFLKPSSSSSLSLIRLSSSLSSLSLLSTSESSILLTSTLSSVPSTTEKLSPTYEQMEAIPTPSTVKSSSPMSSMSSIPLPETAFEFSSAVSKISMSSMPAIASWISERYSSISSMAYTISSESVFSSRKTPMIDTSGIIMTSSPLNVVSSTSSFGVISSSSSEMFVFSTSIVPIWCKCSCEQFKLIADLTSTNKTNEEVAEEVNELLEESTVDKKTTTVNSRKYISAKDERQSATVVGTVGALFFAAVCALIVVSDLPILISIVQRMFRFMKKRVMKMRTSGQQVPDGVHRPQVVDIIELDAE